MKTCTVEGCTRTHLARGLCRFHYDRYRNKDWRKLMDAMMRIEALASNEYTGSARATLRSIACIARVAISETQEGK